MSRIGFIGLGNMGLPMAANLVKAGHAVAGFDVVSAHVDAAAQAGAQPARSVAEAVRGAEVVITMLPAGQHVSEIYIGADGVLASLRGATPLLIDSSTIDVATSRKIAAVAVAAELAMLDAPVSGGVGGATQGTLTFMVGGSDAAFARGEPVLKAMGRTIVHAGAAGAGQAAKICNNMMLGISMIGVAEAFVLAERLGLDAQKLFDVSATASGQCWSLTSYCPVPGPVPGSPANRDYVPGFAASLMLKDLMLAQEAAASNEAATPLGAHAARLFEALNEAGEGGRDFSYVFRWLASKTRGEVA